MRVQLLVATMNQTDSSLIKKMNIQTMALIGNQCNRCSTEYYEVNGSQVVYYNRAKRGVGLNRNTVLLHADGDIITFADDDMVFVDGYENIINTAFQRLPQADAIIFNIETIGASMGRRKNDVIKRIWFHNAFNYGVVRLSVREKSIRRENITFHTCFGGGTRYSAGEDTLFIVDMLKKGLKVYAYPICIATVDQSESTWFKGYNKKYLHDKGALFAAVSNNLARLLCLQDLIRHKYMYKNNKMSIWAAYRIMVRGIKAFQKLEEYRED